ncbi:hypothetical protein DBV10_07835 [Acidovorax sp. FJL06]|nr:hypothetical protein DBV10_07835 [Acidovorax sp. FJL06]
MLPRSLMHSPRHSDHGPLVILSLVALAGLSAPFLFGYGTAPLTNFAGEIVSASGFSTLLWAAAIYGNFDFAHKNIQRTTSALVLLILATIFHYFYFGAINTPAWIVAIGYLGMGWLAAWTGSAARSGTHANEWMKAICIGLSIGAVIAALGSIAQFFNFDGGYIVLSPAQDSGRTFGFVRQPNHQGTFLSIGLASIVYLAYISKYRTRVLALLFAPIIIFALLTTGSRTAMMQIIFLSICIALTFKSRGLRAAASIILLTALLWFGLYILNYLDIANFYGIKKAAQTSSEGVGLRHELWRETWNLIVSHPLIGAGLLYFGSDFILSGAAEKVGLPMTHSHNIILQIIYAFGIPVSIAFITLVARIFLKIRKIILNPGNFIPTTTIGFIGIHSMVEFPLWYTYFLLPFCFHLGWLETQTAPPSLAEAKNTTRKKYLASAIGLSTIMLTTWINSDYYKITPIYAAGLKSTLNERIATASDNFWFQPFSRFVLLNIQPVAPENYRAYLDQAATNGCIMYELWYQPGTIVALTYAERLEEAKWIIYSYWKLSGGYSQHFKKSMEKSDAPSKEIMLDFIEKPHPVERSIDTYSSKCFQNRLQ